MCGYCIEGTVTLDFVESEEIKPGNNWVSVYLQETEDLPGIIEKTKTFDRFANSIDVAFCRLYNQFIEQGFNDTYQLIKGAFDQTSIDKFLKERLACQEGKIWRLLGDPQLYEDDRYWDKFISNRSELIEETEKLIGSYYDFWLIHNEERTEEPPLKIEKFGQKYQLEIPQPKDRAKFKALFPAIYFALIFLATRHPRSITLKRIALKNPDVPDFEGYDLWLQRKAFTACLKSYGFQFIVDNFKAIRYELLAYALLKETIKHDEIVKLRELITTHKQNGIIYMSANGLLQLTGEYYHRI